MCSNIQAQIEINWDLLSHVQWEEYQDSVSGVVLTTALFDEDLLLLNEQEVIISGYVIPLDGLGLSYALSKNSYAACFFCGQAGPETVLELNVRPKSIPSYKQNDVLLTFRGKLVLKSKNPTGLHFILQHARKLE